MNAPEDNLEKAISFFFLRIVADKKLSVHTGRAMKYDHPMLGVTFVVVVFLLALFATIFPEEKPTDQRGETPKGDTNGYK